VEQPQARPGDGYSNLVQLTTGCDPSRGRDGSAGPQSAGKL